MSPAGGEWYSIDVLPCRSRATVRVGSLFVDIGAGIGVGVEVARGCQVGIAACRSGRHKGSGGRHACIRRSIIKIVRNVFVNIVP